MIEQNVKRIIADQMYIKPKEVTNDTALINDLGADSLDVIELILTFEREFNISIPDCDVGSVKTVQNIIDYIKVRKA